MIWIGAILGALFGWAGIFFAACFWLLMTLARLTFALLAFTVRALLAIGLLVAGLLAAMIAALSRRLGG